MDGDMLDLVKFVEVKNKYKLLLYVDEVYFFGIIGDMGCGIVEL